MKKTKILMPIATIGALGAIVGPTLASMTSCSQPTTTFTVMFDLNGAPGEAPAEQKVKSGDKAEEPTAPTYTDHIFKGWFTDGACTQAYDFTQPVTGSMTLYAGWTALFVGLEAQLKTYYPTLPVGYQVTEDDLVVKTIDADGKKATATGWTCDDLNPSYTVVEGEHELVFKKAKDSETPRDLETTLKITGATQGTIYLNCNNVVLSNKDTDGCKTGFKLTAIMDNEDVTDNITTVTFKKSGTESTAEFEWDATNKTIWPKDTLTADESNTVEVSFTDSEHKTHTSAAYNIQTKEIAYKVTRGGLLTPTSISAMADLNATTVVLPNQAMFDTDVEEITAIDDYAFEHDDLVADITIPESYNAIGAAAFHGCTALKNINFQGSTSLLTNWVTQGECWSGPITKVTCSDGEMTVSHGSTAILDSYSEKPVLRSPAIGRLGREYYTVEFNCADLPHNAEFSDYTKLRAYNNFWRHVADVQSQAIYLETLDENGALVSRELLKKDPTAETQKGWYIDTDGYTTVLKNFTLTDKNRLIVNIRTATLTAGSVYFGLVPNTL